MQKTYDFTKLPKWAQTEVERRDRRIQDLERELEAHKAILEDRQSQALEPDWRDKGAILDPHHHKIAIADGHVRYTFSDEKFLYIDTRLIRSEWEGSFVDVHASRGLIIRPNASNSARLFVDGT